VRSRHPRLYEANARIWLRRLSERHGRPLTLATVPDEAWRALARRGFELVWLMGVWRRSPASRAIALAHPELRRAYDEALPGWGEDDVAGSPYAVHAYELDPALGEPGELAETRARLNRCGLGLVLDFVPNHLARDHPWTRTHPERFVRGIGEQVRAHPEWFFPVEGAGCHLAHGRDPHFPPWTDTAQLNVLSADLRAALIEELARVAATADGVRCDMAMLALDDVFRRTWGEILGDPPAPEGELWAEAIARVRAARRDFLFLAEAYWETEGRLIGLGFDFVYDKVLYDRLRGGDAAAVRAHLAGWDTIGQRGVRFVENHDEPRAAAAFEPERGRAAAVAVATLPGLWLLHDGQLEGRRVRLPVQLVREPREPVDPATEAFYARLLAACDAAGAREGEWWLLETRPARAGDERHGQVLAWAWQAEGRLGVVVVNFAPAPAEARVVLPAPIVPKGGSDVRLRDTLAGGVVAAPTPEATSEGLPVALGSWGRMILTAG
jgi:hypothetical protein